MYLLLENEKKCGTLIPMKSAEGLYEYPAKLIS